MSHGRFLVFFVRVHKNGGSEARWANAPARNRTRVASVAGMHDTSTPPALEMYVSFCCGGNVASLKVQNGRLSSCSTKGSKTSSRTHSPPSSSCGLNLLVFYFAWVLGIQSSPHTTLVFLWKLTWQENTPNPCPFSMV